MAFSSSTLGYFFLTGSCLSGPKCERTDSVTVKPMATPRSEKTKSMCFFRKSWISRRQSWEERNKYPLQHSSSLVGWLHPHNRTSTASEGKGGKKEVQHCTAEKFSLFLLLLQLGKANNCGIFSVTPTCLRFYWCTAFWTAGDACLSVLMQKLFSPTEKWKVGNGKIEKQSTP